MHVVATAGHVDHGKSTLVRALTGIEPDRFAEEQRRGMTLDLGFAWTRLPDGSDVAFVDVPGHERFTTTMLAGVGPVPAVLLVVAADAGWAAQTREHVAALDALDVRHVLLAVTRCDLADPGPAIEQVREHLAATSLADPEAVAVSGRTGAGLDELRAALVRLVAGLPAPDTGSRVRLWVDRAFTMTGAGTVVTGTLQAGTVSPGMALACGDDTMVVRSVESLGVSRDAVPAVARVGLALRGVPRSALRRGQALVTPNAWATTRVFDARAARPLVDPPRQVVAHIGSAAIPATVRTFDDRLLRLSVAEDLPLQVGDRVVLRDPGRRLVLGGVTVLDVDPPPLARRGAAARRAADLALTPDGPDLADELRRRGAVPASLPPQWGVPVPAALPAGLRTAGGWLVTEATWSAWRHSVLRAVEAGGEGLADTGISAGTLVARSGLPDAALLAPLLTDLPGLAVTGGRVHRAGRSAGLDPAVTRALGPILAAFRDAPFVAPDADTLRAAGLGPRQLGAAAAAGAVLRLPGDVVLLPDAAEQAVARLAGADQPFTVAQARAVLGTSRRVAVPLLEHLDRIGRTERGADDRRRVRPQG